MRFQIAGNFLGLPALSVPVCLLSNSLILLFCTTHQTNRLLIPDTGLWGLGYSSGSIVGAKHLFLGRRFDKDESFQPSLNLSSLSPIIKLVCKLNCDLVRLIQREIGFLGRTWWGWFTNRVATHWPSMVRSYTASSGSRYWGSFTFSLILLWSC
jgi:hypothetical protein